jgi:hypothetical protein
MLSGSQWLLSVSQCNKKSCYLCYFLVKKQWQPLALRALPDPTRPPHTGGETRGDWQSGENGGNNLLIIEYANLLILVLLVLLFS